MCFNQPIAGIFTVVGFLLAFYVKFFFMKKDEHAWRLFYGVLYFTSMELLQFVQYFWVDQCDNIWNQVLTIVGILHICFQPVFSNLMASYDKPQKHRRVFDTFVRPLTIIGGLFLASKLFFYDFSPCDPLVEPLCGERTCTFYGAVHFVWHAKLRAPNYFTPGAFLHAFLMFVPPLIMKNTFSSLGLLITGPLLGWYLSRGHSEWATIWCFWSIVQNVISICLCLPRPSKLDNFLQLRRAKEKKEKLD
eukprot:Anaeramoba_flamelloidesc43046_g1_i1.p1 GENE.c43046_g1_i1~~c43046_g1_i1.p1  ORF type:complete len:248 (-),score=31.62 c43046_g1_i1:235-978(-)